ncbi:hypothetical protein FCU94_15325 [Vibrio sp. JPW-9-11-11]|uniref:hypothetical protein n=1 Tax=Vibrio sp. JPW-9-11-11 TaxID=1416532 RepID=UPI0015935B1D|nr:hypothetical protein [Vibrio sp. JPW-9-11-11]NVD08244.1 hypothetical protein [Vibrio sp. JPW-9-11-11]
MSQTVIVVRANENLDKKVISQMVSQGFAPGFKASLDRVNTDIKYFVITNTSNDRAVLGSVTHAVEHECTKQTEQNLEGRIDIYFTDSSEVDPMLLYENVDFNNSNPVRYINKYW